MSLSEKSKNKPGDKKSSCHNEGDSFRVSDLYELKKLMQTKSLDTRVFGTLEFTQEEIEMKNGVEVTQKEVLKSNYKKSTVF